MKTIVWFRQDLRLFDNPALFDAARNGEILAVYIYPQGLGGASYWWLHHSLEAFSKSLEAQGVRLILRTGQAETVLTELAQQCSADKVVWNRVYSPQGIEQGRLVKERLTKLSIKAQSFNGQLISEPAKIFNQQGKPYKVFTPFWRYCMQTLTPEAPLERPKECPKLTGFADDVTSQALADWGLLPTKPNWAQGLQKRWQPGEQGAQLRWQHFLQKTIQHYKSGRDFPAQDNTSYLSPHLAFGEISPRQLWHDIHQSMAANQIDAGNGQKFLAEIGWREFSYYLLFHFSDITTEPFNQKFTEFPWQHSDKHLKSWQQGLTGYPIVDAGMRELWQTGYMHNRVRMLVASFLTKHCLINWREGADWFWDTLVDADIASNTASWQWVAGCGADAAPYFRIFNPIIQGEKFDKEGVYIRKWLPELHALPNKFIHKPWLADPKILQSAGVQLGQDYPLPIVDHACARVDALAAYQSIR